jgi:CxxC motif-containing protein (DUF1111 family)
MDGFVAEALLGDMSLTSPLLPDELPNPDGLTDDRHHGTDVSADDLDLIADYVRLLAIPARSAPDDEGAAIFAAIGCADCHVPTLHTRVDYPIEPLADIDAPLYSDLLLHDRGVELADGLVEGEATSREWRTAPLIGLRFFDNFMHDGRAATLEEAILVHSGEGSESADTVTAWLALDDADQRTLLGWLRGL